MVDSNGNIWMKVNLILDPDYRDWAYGIFKINIYNNTLEMAFSSKNWYGVDYPTEIGPNKIKYNYLIYYLQ